MKMETMLRRSVFRDYYDIYSMLRSGLKEDKMDYIVGLIDRVLHDPENEDNIAAVRRTDTRLL